MLCCTLNSRVELRRCFPLSTVYEAHMFYNVEIRRLHRRSPYGEWFLRLLEFTQNHKNDQSLNSFE